MVALKLVHASVEHLETRNSTFTFLKIVFTQSYARLRGLEVKAILPRVSQIYGFRTSRRHGLGRTRCRQDWSCHAWANQSFGLRAWYVGKIAIAFSDLELLVQDPSVATLLWLLAAIFVTALTQLKAPRERSSCEYRTNTGNCPTAYSFFTGGSLRVLSSTPAL